MSSLPVAIHSRSPREPPRRKVGAPWLDTASRTGTSRSLDAATSCPAKATIPAPSRTSRGGGASTRRSVGQAVAPVLEELGGRAGVVDLVEVHPGGLVDAIAAKEQRGDDQHDDETGRAGPAAAGLAVERRGPIGRSGVSEMRARSGLIGPSSVDDGADVPRRGERGPATAARAGAEAAPGAGADGLPGPEVEQGAPPRGPGPRRLRLPARQASSSGSKRRRRASSRRASPGPGAELEEPPEERGRVEHAMSVTPRTSAGRRRSPASRDTAGLVEHGQDDVHVRNVATLRPRSAIGQRHEKASRIAARPKNGNR